MKRLVKNRYFKYILLGIILASMPLLQEFGILNSSTITVFGSVLFYSIVALGLNILLGYSGLISLGTAGFMGLGGYISAYLTTDLNLPFIVSLIISLGVSLIIGVLVGLISLRINGMYLAIATLAVSEIFRKVFVEFETVTNGFSGKNAGYPEFFGITLDRNGTFIFLVFILITVMILTDNFIHSATGRALLTMRVSESAAQAMGINLLKYKVMAFAIATVYAALGGVLYVHFIRFSYPSTWNTMLSLQILAVIVIGGLKTISGPIVGSIIVFGVPELILKNIPVIGSIDGLAYIFTGVLIISVVLFYPHGLIYLGSDIKNLFKRKVKSNGNGTST